MSEKTLTKSDAKAAVYGGAILGGGGGGWIDDGLNKTEEIFKIGQPTLISIDALDADAYVPCVALVGAPSSEDFYASGEQIVSTVERMIDEFDQPLQAIMTNENGAATTINGWLQSASLGLPFLDAPCNGRAHPTGAMGSMNLTEIEDYLSIQAFAGGKGEKEVEGVIRGSLDVTAASVREISVQAGGLVAVCRNPVNVEYIKENAAVGGITAAIELGKVFLSKPEGYERIEAATAHLEGKILSQGPVTEFKLEQSGGFDVGFVKVKDVSVTIWNEYMTAEKNGERVGTFPDLIMTFDTKTGLPLVSAELAEGKDITVMNVPKEKLILSSTMYNEKLLKVIEPVINQKIV